MSDGIANTLRRNARVSMLTWVWGQGLNLARMMVLINFLSTEGYGLWIFSFSIMSYFVVYNFGIATAFVKYTAELHAQGKHERLGELLSTGMSFGFLLAAGILLFFFRYTDAAVAFFNIPEANVDDARFVIFGVAIVSAFSMATAVYTAVLNGIQRIDLVNYCFTAGITIEFIVMIVALRMGFGIQVVTVLYAANVVCSTMACAWFARRLLPNVRINPFHFRMDAVMPLFNLGGKMQLLGMVAVMVSSLDILVFMKFGSQSFVGIYGTAQRLAQRAQGLALQGFGMLTPASADLLARGEHAKLASVYAAAQRFTLTGSAMIFGYMAAFPEVLMRFVMDSEYDPAAAFALRALAAGLFFHTLTGPASSMLRGAGMPFRETFYHILTAALFFGLFYPLMRADANGALDPRIAATWPAALGAASFTFILIGNRFFQVPLLTPFREMGPLLLATAIIGAALRLGWEALPVPEPASRWPALVAMFATGVPFVGLFALASFLLPGLTGEDREQLVRFVPGGGRFLSRRALRRGDPE